jgi:phosphoribosylformimino-5-aminoimidazole carboxamide ribotide isomerase
MNSLRVIPVLDLKGGVVVRGIAGRRQEYRPVISKLTVSTDPLDVARAFRDVYGFNELYLADLDAIAGLPAARPIYSAIRALGFSLWVDAGIRNPAMASCLAEDGIERIVVGLETVSGPAVLAELIARYGSGRIVFSLDLRDGRPLGDLSSWHATDAWSIATQVLHLQITTLIVLDLARVGGRQGTGTEELCQRLAATYPTMELIAGGGVRGPDDLVQYQALGVRGVLVSSALHDSISMLTALFGCRKLRRAGAGNRGK